MEPWSGEQQSLKQFGADLAPTDKISQKHSQQSNKDKRSTISRTSKGKKKAAKKK